MPEYLAPAVYVEETSFRAKSIEGVSTSTTAFAGPTRTGPSNVTPALLTSFADFQRIYGGLEDLLLADPSMPRTNYLAHAVRAYFDEGGGRLYVARVVSADAKVAEANITGLTGSKFKARFPGSGGNRTIRVREAEALAPVGVIRRAPVGSVARVKVAASQATPAMVSGGASTSFSLADGDVLNLQVTLEQQPAAAVQVIFHGRNAEVFGDSVLGGVNDQVKIVAATNDTLTVAIDDVVRTLKLRAGTLTRADVLAEINRKLRGGYARLSDESDVDPQNPNPQPMNRLIVGTDKAGSSARVEIFDSPALAVLGLVATASPPDDPYNNVPDLSAVTILELHALVSKNNSGVSATSVNGNLTFSTAPGPYTLTVLAGSANAALGLVEGQSDVGQVAKPSSFLYLKTDAGWSSDPNANAPALADAELPPDADQQGTPVKAGATILTLTLLIEGTDGREVVYEGVGLDGSHPRSIDKVLSENPTSRAESLTRGVAIALTGSPTAWELHGALLDENNLDDRERIFTLGTGTDGNEPTENEYKTALTQLAGVEDISIVAAPGSSAYASGVGTMRELIKHAEARRSYRIAVLDTPQDKDPTEARDYKAAIDSKYAALYYPWVMVPNPLARAGDASIPKEIALPPSGFVSGIYARSDIERGVVKAPANEVVRSALRFARDVNFGEQELLNPLGVNCLRFFPGRGYRLWGARTTSSDSEWKHVNVRRYFNYLERSIDVGMQWAVFEPNGERLWANVREAISNFLYNEWRNGALLGEVPKHAYFVRCDRSTMTQDDLDNGRLVCLVGVAVVKPAEFVIFRVGQKTADARS